ncbi:hypothetical protein [Candidatus Laterigemmans baculatus]|uniref:hypothetical protein n=1 Tax=Candidatus Laterigemmans baculatus TaxID=2770505 RepID=UPI0013DB02ED|nr:hypothetical protein [Candidatus Laterigemmans baculatus]
MFAEIPPPRHAALPGMARSAKISSGYQAASWALGGLVACGILVSDSVPPLRAVVLMAAMLTALALLTASTTAFSILPRLTLFLYALPFSATVGYLFDQDFVWWETPMAVPLCLDPVLNARMVWIGICGLTGLACGIHLRSAIGVQPPRESTQPRPRVLSAVPFFILLVAAVLLSQLSAPSKTIWEASYASEAATSAGANLNFNASFLVSYLILILLYIDSENEPSGSKRRGEKRIWIAAASLYIVVVLQLMRGDRECTGLLAGIVALYLTSGHQSKNWLLRNREKLRRAAYVTVPSIAIICVLISLGFLRSTLSTGESALAELSTIPKRALTLNTWTGVLLTNLGMVAEEARSDIDLKHGSTYVDYLLSLPPGMITQAVGYKRPMDGTNSPNWWYDPLCGGGVHPCVVPYNNFGILGVFAIMALMGFFVTRCELLAQGHGLGNRVLYGCVVTVSMLWLWYGDMNLIRGLMGCGILIVVHRIGSVPHFHHDVLRRGQQTA